MSEFVYRLKELAFFIPRHIGKIVGGALGYFVFKSVIVFVALLIFGHEFDKVFSGRSKDKITAIRHLSPKKRINFIRVFFNVMGHIAKADGRVSELEIEVAEGLMQELELTNQEKEMAIRSFNDGKDPHFPLAETLQNFYKMFRSHITLREWFLRLQIQAAIAGDGISSVVAKMLNASAAQLDIPGSRFSDLVREAKIHSSFAPYGRKQTTGDNYFKRKKRQSQYSRYNNEHDGAFKQKRQNQYKRTQKTYQNDPLAEAYILLGVSVADDAKHITRAYRRLLSQNHPDKVIGQGAGKVKRDFAHAKTIEIRQAYELIKERRNF